MDAMDVLETHFRTVRVDPLAWRDLFASDATLEMPFAPSHVPNRVTGVEAIVESVTDFFSQFKDDFKIDVKHTYRVDGGEAAFAEFSAIGTIISTGKVYKQDYILYIRVKSGKIVLYREYFDGARLVAAFTP